MTIRHPSEFASRTSTLLKLFTAAGVCTSILAAHPARTLAQPGTFTFTMPPAIYLADRVDFDEEGSPGEDFDPSMMMRRGPGGGDDRIEFKTDLGKRIQRLDFTRNPQSIVAARAKLAAQAREKRLRPPEEPKLDEPKPEDVKPESPKSAATPSALPAPASTPAPTPAPASNSPTPATLPSIPLPTAPATNPADPAAPEAPSDMPPGMDDSSPGRATNQRAISPAQRKAREAAQKALTDKAENFRLLVVAGDWKSVGDFIQKDGGEDKKSIYAHVLNALVSADQAMVPDEVLELSEASPDALNEKLITSLGQILSNTSQRGSQASAVAPQIKAGTAHFGGTDPAKRKNAATLLVAAGLPIEAQEYLPALEVAREQKDPELLNLYAVYFDALAKSKQGTPREEAIAQGWRTTMEVLSLESAKPEQREKALALALIFINDIPQDEGDAFLKRLFASEPDMGWKAVDSVSNRSRQLRQRNAKPDERVKALLSARRVGLAMLDGSGDAFSSWRTGLNLLTGLFVEEAELSRRVSARGAANEGMEDPAYAGRYNPNYNEGANRQQIIPADMLGTTLPTPAWLRSIDQGLAAKLELMVASTAAASGDTAAVLSMIKPIVKTDPDRALKLASALVSAWPSYARRTPGDPSAGAGMYNRTRYYNPYAMYGGYGGYGYDAGGGVPLTRAKQERVIAQLKDVLTELRALNLKGISPAALVGAFAASHSDAEVYQPQDIQAVFGDPSTMEPEVRSLLVANMRTRLASTWRQPRIQQAAGSKRTDKELTAMVLRGYDVAVALANISIQAKPDSFEAHAAMGDLFFDKAEFLYGQKADMAVYTATRAQAFTSYDRASELYSGALKSGSTKPSARVFMQWFNSALGASELGQLTRQDNADQQQVAAVAAAIDALGPDQAAKHRALFAQEAQTASRSLPPELKVRFLRLASQIIGSAPEGKDARAMLDYYDDLTKEIQLSLTVDGSTNTPAGQPFGAQLAIWCTRAVSRESGSFARYLTADGYNPITGQPINYKEDIEKHLRERLSDKFEILSVTFHKPTVQPISIARPGWEQFPLAYLLLKPKDVSVDRLPQVKIDMDFSDGQGSVIIPITSTEVLLDARTTAGAQPPARPVGDLQLEMILDNRVIPPALQPTQLASAGEPLPTSPIRLEIRAKGKGLIPDLNRVIDTSSLAGVKLDRVEDKGLNIVELDASGTEVVPIAERSWMLHLSPTSAGAIDFAFPKAAAAVAGQTAPKITIKQFSDADIVDAKPIVTIGSPISLISRLWPALVAIASAAIAAALLIFLIRRNPKAAAVKAPPVSVPANLTPFTAVATLRKIQSLNGTALPPPAQEELAIAIKTLERRYFGPAATTEAQDIELRPIVQTWVDRIAR